MQLSRFAFSSALVALLAVPSAASAQEANQKQYVMDLGAGLMAQPRYPGSDETIFVPYPLFAVGRFFVPGVGEFDEKNNVRRLTVYPSFNFIAKRDHSDSNELKGMEDVDWSIEAGLGVAYRYDWIRGFVEVRQGFNGYSGQVAQFGVDFIANPTEDLELLIGPRASWGSDGYMETYFGITNKEAANSPNYNKSYNADAGFNSVGIAANARYDLTDKWKLHLLAGWDRLIGDAGDSPIVKEGSENQFYGGAGITYEFAFDVF
ncbi:MipA/OmpV family protein [Aestuariivirga sp.]|uniref:MipA/OmpV family protein n=1 Tax=Aestuariivirga sp. TaxID=2650926 RepID=UPI003BAC7C65